MADKPERETVHRELETSADAADPASQVAQMVADIEGRDMSEMATMWACTDEVLQHLFSDPPRAEAQMRVEFSYENYRIAVDQDGTAEFRKVESPS